MNFMHSLADILIAQSVARRWLTLRLVQPYMQSKLMDGKECVIFDAKHHGRSEMREDENEELEVSSVNTNDLVRMWKARGGRRITASNKIPIAVPHSHPRRERARLPDL
mmetsp:Transcript_11200/g.16679  ORF Transcript_11200/g.16679 Transcript_11200/m.16679 type:complete len:109 (-) Transcript_11200:139-465(-)